MNEEKFDQLKRHVELMDCPRCKQILSEELQRRMESGEFLEEDIHYHEVKLA